MKKFTNKVLATLLFLFAQGVAFAQDGDGGLDVDVSLNDQTQWYQNPLYWVIGGLFFLLLIAIIARGGSKK